MPVAGTFAAGPLGAPSPVMAHLGRSAKIKMYLLPELISAVPYIAYALSAAYLAVIVILAFSVFRDAHIRKITNKGTFLVGPFLWALIILLTGGFFGALAYWLVHYSALRYASKE